MPRDSSATGALRPFGMLKAFGSIGALPQNPRSMLVYDASLTWAAILLLAIGLVMVYSSSIAMAEDLVDQLDTTATSWADRWDFAWDTPETEDQ